MTKVNVNYNTNISKNQAPQNNVDNLVISTFFDDDSRTHVENAIDYCQSSGLVEEFQFDVFLNKAKECCKKFLLIKNDSNEYKLVPIFCKLRLCPTCARRRSSKWVEKLKNVRFQFPMFLTLTMPVGPDLSDSIARIISSFQKFRRHFKLKKGVYAIEIVPKGNGNFYVHLHSLVDCVWLDGEEVSEYWGMLTGAYVKKIKRVRNVQETIREVCKYVSKCVSNPNIADEVKEEILQSIKHRKLVNMWGIQKDELSLLDTIEISLQKCRILGVVRRENVRKVAKILGIEYPEWYFNDIFLEKNDK